MQCVILVRVVCCEGEGSEFEIQIMDDIAEEAFLSDGLFSETYFRDVHIRNIVGGRLMDGSFVAKGDVFVMDADDVDLVLRTFYPFSQIYRFLSQLGDRCGLSVSLMSDCSLNMSVVREEDGECVKVDLGVKVSEWWRGHMSLGVNALSMCRFLQLCVTPDDVGTYLYYWQEYVPDDKVLGLYGECVSIREQLWGVLPQDVVDSFKGFMQMCEKAFEAVCKEGV